MRDGLSILDNIVSFTNGELNYGSTLEHLNVLNAEDGNDVAMKEILLENGFPIEFPDDVLEEAARIPDTIAEEEIKK